MSKKDLDKNSQVVKTVPESEKIWNEIKDKEILMFALPNQLVFHYCSPIVVEPSKCYLKSTASSVLPALETALGRNYTVELMDKYIVVARVNKLPFSK